MFLINCTLNFWFKDGNKSAEQCVINKVHISPCPEAKAEEPGPCQLPKGSNSTVIFDFTPSKNESFIVIDISFSIVYLFVIYFFLPSTTVIIRGFRFRVEKFVCSSVF